MPKDIQKHIYIAKNLWNNETQLIYAIKPDLYEHNKSWISRNL